MFCKEGFSREFMLTFVAFVMRAIAAACAKLGAPPPWFPDTGSSGVLAPVLDIDDGATKFPEDSLNNEGI